ncbi:discoidin domain-containing protein [Akkermansiaceae bacterium]|nr:discoidin domain-containing protein [Akkermansiaceae bacterium]
MTRFASVNLSKAETVPTGSGPGNLPLGCLHRLKSSRSGRSYHRNFRELKTSQIFQISLPNTHKTLACSALSAAPRQARNFIEGLAIASEEKSPLIVYVHGSAWHPASRLFKAKIWESDAFLKTLPNEVVLGDIELGQQLSEEEAKAQAESLKDWNRKSVRTFPAIQVFGNDGHLLKTYQGREMREMISPAILSGKINAVLKTAAARRDLLAKIDAARAKKDAAEERDFLISLIELSLAQEPKIIDQLKAVDPEDESGWQARLRFRNWEFVRHVTGLIGEGKTYEAVAEADRLLANPLTTPEQRSLILGAKGSALVAQEKFPDAWDCFQQARDADPDGANGKAMWRHGLRVAGKPLRAILPDSPLYGKDLGTNISRGHATFTQSSSQHDDPKNHASLFSGPIAKGGAAFHTTSQNGAHIIIDLSGTCEVSALSIKNRGSNSERAEGLALWGSLDGKDWEKLWSATEVQSTWDILLESPKQCAYLKIGLDGDRKDYLHLATVDVFGTRSGE